MELKELLSPAITKTNPSWVCDSCLEKFNYKEIEAIVDDHKLIHYFCQHCLYSEDILLQFFAQIDYPEVA